VYSVGGQDARVVGIVKVIGKRHTIQYSYSFKHALPSMTCHSFALESSAVDLEGSAAATAPRR
jgi:hypothetical protein